MASSSRFKMEWTKKSSGGSSSKRKREDAPRKREDAPKKHRSSEFFRQSNRGVVTKLDSSDVRSIITGPDAQVVVRPLGERVETFSSQQTVYVESVVEEDVIGGLQARISSVEALLRDMAQKNLLRDRDMAQENLLRDIAQKNLEERLDVSDLFVHQGMCNALRAFSDLILGAFFKACGKEALGARERAEFLSNRGADGGEAFVTRGAVTLTVFGVEKKIGRREFQIMQSLRRASSGVSSVVSHSASPLEVATALEVEGASMFGKDFNAVCGLFRSFFDVTCKKMVQEWKEGQVKDNFKKKFKPDRPPQI